MQNRRKFISQSAAGMASLPFLTSEGLQTFDPSFLRGMDTEDNEAFWRQVRLQFPLSKNSTYFNNGTMGPMPGYVLNKVIDHLSHYAVHAAEVDYKDGSGPELLTGYFPYIELREKIGKIINADYKNIALTQNATFGMNFIANGLDFKVGDEIINTDQEHGGGFAAWQQLAKRFGCIYKQAKLPIPANDPEKIIDSIFSKVTQKTKIIAIPHIVSVYGVVMPVKEICRRAKEQNIFTVLDGAQAVGQIKVDVTDIGCDAYYSSLHKWLLAPAGNGILYIHPDLINNVWASLPSYQWENKEDNGFRLMQYGSGNPAILAGLDAAVEFYQTIGEEKWLNRIKELSRHLRNGLADLKNVTISSPVNDEMCGGITTYQVEGLSGPELQKMMWDKEKLQPRSVGSELLRHSVHIYNSKEEIDRGLKLIKSIS